MAALLALALSAVVVYPVMLFGALFVGTGFFAAANTLTVEVRPSALVSAWRLFGLRYRERRLPKAAIAVH